MRVLVAGCGAMGRLHGRALRRAGVALCCLDAVPSAAERFATELGAEPIAELATAIGRGVDGAVITAPTLSHPQLVSALIEAGIPSFCEKPLALGLDETARVGALADRLGVPLQIGFHRRCDPGYRRVRDAVHDGALGRIRIVRAGTHTAGLPVDAAACGSILVDLQIHDFDAVHFVTGRQTTAVTTVAVDTVDEPWNAEAVVSVLELRDGGAAVVTGGRPSPPGYDARIEVHGSEGSIAAGLDARTPMAAVPRDGDPPAYARFADRFADAYAAEMRDFVRVIAGEVQSPCTWRDSYAALRVALAAERSARAGGARVPVDAVT